MAKKNFIQLANIKTGSFREQLGLKENQKVLLSTCAKIKNTPIGKIAKIPQNKGRKTIRVTSLVKKRATLCHTLMKMNRK
jgi:hypothetical protein